MYSIWKYFPKEVRKKVSEKSYETIYRSSGYVTKDGYCPLGAGLKELCLLKGKNSEIKIPNAGRVVDILFDLGVEGEYYELERFAFSFINRGDKREITDLKKALGVDK